jgi:hypothetical protein
MTGWLVTWSFEGAVVTPLPQAPNEATSANP